MQIDFVECFPLEHLFFKKVVIAIKRELTLVNTFELTFQLSTEMAQIYVRSCKLEKKCNGFQFHKDMNDFLWSSLFQEACICPTP